MFGNPESLLVILTPFVKWAGGKRQLLDKILERKPEQFGTYFEPFVGGGAVLFSLQHRPSHINDINEQLVFLYSQVRDNCEILINEVQKLDGLIQRCEVPKDFYYEVRKDFNRQLAEGKKDVLLAARLIFLNKHCFNGLYRVNARGEYNVPYNASIAKSLNEDNIRNVSAFLKEVKISNGDFEVACASAKKGDFIFLDSPYAPLNPTSFTAYTKAGFPEKEHRRLARLFNDLDERGCYCMLTNHNTNLIQELYGQYHYEEVDVRRFINSDSSNRKGKEVIIRNYG